MGRAPNNTPKKSWSGTGNNYTAESYSTFKTWCDKMCTSYVIGKEVGKKGTPHLQVCLVLSTTMRFSQITTLYPLWHWEATRGIKASKTYCRKDGDYVEKGGSQGKRQELVDAVELIHSAKSWTAVVTNPNLYAVMASHQTWCRLMWDHRKVAPVTGLTLRPWQVEAEKYMLSEPDDRTIAWYHDWRGSTGKTILTNYMIRNHGATTLGGKTTDILYAYQDEPIAIFQYPKDYPPERFHYRAMERIKDGIYCNVKFHSHLHIRTSPVHVVVMANAPPDKSRLSADRWGHVVELDERPAFSVFSKD